MVVVKDPYHKVCKYKLCGKEFLAKRTNQEYCSREHYIKANNAIAKQLRDSTKSEDYKFHQNWRILKDLYSDGTIEIDKVSLEKRGYILVSHTHSKRIENSNKYILFCYEYGLELIDNQNFKIIKS